MSLLIWLLRSLQILFKHNILCFSLQDKASQKGEVLIQSKQQYTIYFHSLVRYFYNFVISVVTASIVELEKLVTESGNACHGSLYHMEGGMEEVSEYFATLSLLFSFLLSLFSSVIIIQLISCDNLSRFHFLNSVILLGSLSHCH